MTTIDLHDFLADVAQRKAAAGIVDRDPDEAWQEAVARKVRKLERLAELAEAGATTDISGLDRAERRRLLWGDPDA
jgi:UDP-N-acetylmuramyl pentapeptide synthase